MGAMAEVKKPNNTIDKLALIVTTYKRQQLLETLFDSILALEQAPWRIVIVTMSSPIRRRTWSLRLPAR